MGNNRLKEPQGQFERHASGKRHTLSKSIGLLASLALSLLFACVDQEQSIDDNVRRLDLQVLPGAFHPESNLPSQAKIDLGKKLFYDPILSGPRNITCASCHHPTLGYSDRIDLSKGPGGAGLGPDRLGGILSRRNSITILNAGYVGATNAQQGIDAQNQPYNWHMLRRSLEAQAFGPLASTPVMKGSGSYDATTVKDTLVRRLKKIPSYVMLFDQAFDGTNGSGLTADNLGKAIAVFERSLITTNSPYERYARGDNQALTDQQKQGLLLFFGKANCSTCHSGPAFSDGQAYNLGLADHSSVIPIDLGKDNLRLFRVPSLLNIEETQPYMHNGLKATLRDVVEYYNRGVPENPNVVVNTPQEGQTQISSKIKPLGLSSDEVDALIEFMKALTGDYDKTIPSTVPSGLKVGGN